MEQDIASHEQFFGALPALALSFLFIVEKNRFAQASLTNKLIRVSNQMATGAQYNDQ
jgi:hypothetical protein